MKPFRSSGATVPDWVIGMVAALLVIGAMIAVFTTAKATHDSSELREADEALDKCDEDARNTYWCERSAAHRLAWVYHEGETQTTNTSVTLGLSCPDGKTLEGTQCETYVPGLGVVGVIGTAVAVAVVFLIARRTS